MPRIMSCITIHQPYASLIMHGIKTWETRPSPPHGDMCPPGVRGLPGVRINAGDRIAIHAAKRWTPGFLTWFDVDGERGLLVDEAGGILDEDSAGYRYVRPWSWSLPLGAILGTVTVEYAAPILDDPGNLWIDDPELGRITDFGPPGIYIGGSPDGSSTCALAHLNGDLYNSGAEGDISDQLPYGDWVPGRWAWRLYEPEPFDQPIPAKGRQGVWRWEP